MKENHYLKKTELILQDLRRYDLSPEAFSKVEAACEYLRGNQSLDLFVPRVIEGLMQGNGLAKQYAADLQQIHDGNKSSPEVVESALPPESLGEVSAAIPVDSPAGEPSAQPTGLNVRKASSVATAVPENVSETRPGTDHTGGGKKRARSAKGRAGDVVGPSAPVGNAVGSDRFTPWMIEDVKKSGICPLVAYALKMRPIKACQYQAVLGFNPDDQVDGMTIPFRSPTTGDMMKTADGRDFMRIKLERPVRFDDSEAKYLSPIKGGQHAYILPDTHSAIIGGAPVVLTEGEKKSIAATLAGVPTIGLTGNWGWVGEGKRLLPELESYVQPGATWVVIWDSDAATNPKFTKASEAFSGALGEHKCRLKVCILPGIGASAGPVCKTGVDDFLLHPDGGIQRLRDCLAGAKPVFHETFPPTADEWLAAIAALGWGHDDDDLESLLRWSPKITRGMDKLAVACLRKKLQSVFTNLKIKSVSHMLDAVMAPVRDDTALAGRAVRRRGGW